MLSEIWMESECVAKKLTFSMPKDQGTRPVIVAILVVPLFETLEDLTEEVDHHVTDVDDLIVDQTGDHHTIHEVREEVEPHQEDILHHEELTSLKFQIFPQDADGKI